MTTRHRGAAVTKVIGEVMITLGVLLGLFVVWEVWWTDVEASAAQQTLVTAWEDEPAAPVDRVATPQSGPPPVLDAPPVGTTFALLRVPRWGEGYVMPISEGVDRVEVLDRLGIGHYPGTAMPGAVGNVALAGHRLSHGRPFHGVATLVPGDPLVVETSDAWYVYRVTESEVVEPGDVEVIAPVPGDPAATPTEAMITLTTCHPVYSTTHRFVVHGVLEYWALRTDGVPAELTSASAGASPDRTD